MDCEQAKILLAPHILGDLNNDPQRCRELQAHLLCCTDCAEMYEDFKEVIRFVRNHKAEFAQAFKNIKDRERKGIVLAKSISNEPSAFIEKSSYVYKPKIKAAEGYLHRSDLTESTRKPRSLKLFLRIGTVAACFVIGVLTWMVFTNHSKHHTLSQNIVSPEVSTTPKPSVKVELVKPNGNIVINTGQTIVADKELKTLLINGKHRMVMDTGTVLSIEPTVKHSNIGCLVKLDSGQIYAHVQHDGNPFEVHAPHGKAVITGTVFDVSVTDDKTTLVVAEGSVSFESDLGEVVVLAGHKSQLRAQSKPTEPLACNANQLIAWASEAGSQIQAQIEGNLLDDMTDLLNESLASILYSSVSQPIDLESLDYDEFVESKRKWFKMQFPWIFELKKVLNDKGIDVDYPELLIKTGDIWQIVYPERAYRIIPVIYPNSLLAVAEEYGLDKKVCSQLVLSARQYHTIQSNMAFGLAALEKWLADCRRIQSSCIGTKDIESLYESSQAIGEYLENTIAMVWLCMQNNICSISLEHRGTLLRLLEEAVVDAFDVRTSLRLKSVCSDSLSGFDEYIRCIDQLVTTLKVINDYEAKLDLLPTEQGIGQ
jgi:hypothetical protein